MKQSSGPAANRTKISGGITPPPLRYYDPEVQDAANAEPFDRERLERAYANAECLRTAYLKQLKTLSSRMSKRTYSLFADRKDSMWDGDLIEFSFGDTLPLQNGNHRSKSKLTIRATFRSFDYRTLHLLSYEGIHDINVNVPRKRWFHLKTSRIDSLLAHELVGDDPHVMQHTLLFASGAIISLAFERVRWQTRRNP